MSNYKIAYTKIGAILAFPRISILPPETNVVLHVGFYEFLKGATDLGFGVEKNHTITLTKCLFEMECDTLTSDTFTKAYSVFLSVIVGKNLEFKSKGVKMRLIPRLNVNNNIRSQLSFREHVPSDEIDSVLSTSAINEILFEVGVTKQARESSLKNMSTLDKLIMYDLIKGNIHNVYFKRD